MCPSGKYCDPYELNNVTGIIVPVDCPPGYYCPVRTEFAYQNPCAPGTFSNVTQLTAQGEASTMMSVVLRIEYLLVLQKEDVLILILLVFQVYVIHTLFFGKLINHAI